MAVALGRGEKTVTSAVCITTFGTGCLPAAIGTRAYAPAIMPAIYTLGLTVEGAIRSIVLNL